jgi:small-conductance mechanosensitive channel
VSSSFLEKLFGIASQPTHARVIGSILIIVLTLGAAVAARRRRRSLTMTTFLLIAGSMMLSLSTRLIGDPAIEEKISSLAVVLFLFGIIRLTLEGIDAATRRGRAHFSTIFKDLVMLALWAIVVLVVAYTDFGVQPLSILTTTTVFAAVLGFALQETLGNIFSGLTLQLQRPFEPGDWVKSGGHVGRVRGMGWRSTTIITRAQERLEVPNAMVAKDVLVNYGEGSVRDEVTVGISYEVAPNRVREVVMRLMHDMPHILREPPPEVQAWDFGESAIQYKIRYWIDDYGAQETARDKVISALWYMLRRHAIQIPFPIRTIETREKPADHLSRDDVHLVAELRHVDFLRGLSEEELKVLVPTVQVRQYGAGETIVRQGDEADSFYFIRHGTVEVIARTPSGQTRHIADIHQRGFFGHTALMLGEPRDSDCRARTDVEVIEMDREGFTRLFKAHPECAEKMSEIIAAQKSERLELLAAASNGGERLNPRQWLMQKMKEVFSF